MSVSYLEVKISPNSENVEVLQALLSQLDFESFVDDENYFLGYIQKNVFDEKSLIVLKEKFDFTFEVKEIEDKNWNEEWEKNFDPIVVDNKCVIRAAFHQVNENVKDEIIITPKMSFGTGHHPTTYMMVNQMYKMYFNDKSVLDMGCGTGVLAILAKKRGAGYTLGVDIDSWAVDNSKENCENNGYSEINIIEGGAEKLVNYQKFDVILANINRNILLEDMKFYALALKEEGEILFSGFYIEDNSLLREEALNYNFKLIDQNERENWSLMHFKRFK